MDRPYDSIPRQGEHLGSDRDEEPTTNVRAQEAVKPSPDEPSGGGVYQCAYNEQRGYYRIRRWSDDADIGVSEGFEEIHRTSPGGPFDEILETLPERPRFVVFENQETGEVYFDREGEISDNWSGDGRFDQVTIFDEEAPAEAYAKSQQEKT